jgi:ABC-2 type transport system permease protein
MYKAWLFIKRGLVNMFSYKTALALGVLGSFVGILQFTFMGRFLSEGNTFSAIEQYGGNIIAYLIIGSAFTAFLGVSLNSFQGAIRSEQQMGTLEHLLMGPAKLELLLIYSGAWSFLNTLLNVTILLAVIVFVFGISLEMNLVGAVFTLILTILGLSGIGLMSAGIIMVTKIGDPITWSFTTLTGLLSGVLFPIEYLPPYLKMISYILPTTHALHALRMTLIQNAPFFQILPQIMILILTGMITLPLGFYMFRWGFDKARRTGTLAEY